MNDKYIYKGPPEERTFGALPEGDYDFQVLGVELPYWKNEKWILSLKLIIKPSGISVFANPWSGVDKNGEERDGIAEFLHAVGRVPKPGLEPDWKTLSGARGRCRLKVEIAGLGALAGKQVNKVAYWHRPHDLGGSGDNAPRKQTERKDPRADAGEPDEIPFKTTIYREVKRNRFSCRYVQ